MGEIVNKNETDLIRTPARLDQLPQLKESTDRALQKVDHAMNVWTHSRSGMVLKNMIVGGEYSLLRQMRQVAAELQRKKDALTESKYTVLKRKQLAKIKREEAQNEDNNLKREYLELEAAELDDQALMVERPYIGAMREVMELTRLHDSLEKQIREKYGKFDEEVFEIEEAKYWVKRGIAQSLRDVRQFGVITVGNQELLEQIGLDPLPIQRMLKQYLEHNSEVTFVGSDSIEKLLNDCADHYYQASIEKTKRLGFPLDIETNHLMLEVEKTTS